MQKIVNIYTYFMYLLFIVIELDTFIIYLPRVRNILTHNVWILKYEIRRWDLCEKF